ALALRNPSLRALAAALLIILGGMPIGWLLGWLQGFVMEVPEEFLTALENLFTAERPAELAWLLLLAAVTPAICEELVFRGVLLHGLASRMTPGRAILLSAVIFGAFHLSTATIIRFLPSAWLGLLLGIVVWRTGSLATGMLMHLVNNGVVVLLLAAPALGERILDPEGAPSLPLMVAGFALLGAGWWARPPRDRPSEAGG